MNADAQAERRVLALMADGQERTPRMITDALFGPQEDPWRIDLDRLAVSVAAHRLHLQGELAMRKDGEGRTFYRWGQ